MIDTSVPLVWTSKGNLPESDLRYVPLWEDKPDRVQLVEEWYLGAELVKRNVHNYVRKL